MGHAQKRSAICYPTVYMILIFGFNVLTASSDVRPAKFGDIKLMYEWTVLDLDWPSEAEKAEAIKNGSYVPERNLIAGIKIYKTDVFVTIPRWRWTSGQPATLLKVVQVRDLNKLRPYPDWASQTVGDCSALQYVQSMEVDPNTGLMYVIDTGRIGIAGSTTPLNLCPPKIVVYNLQTNQKVESYEFPEFVVSRKNNFMNDLVLDYVGGTVRYAHITDVAMGKLYTFDFKTKTAHYLEHFSMKAENDGGTEIDINNETYTFNANVDGIALSPDFQYLYYSPLGGFSLYQVPTSTLRNPKHTGPTGIRRVGRKVSQSDGLAYGNKNRLYFGALGLSSIFVWDVQRDLTNESQDISQVSMHTQMYVTGNRQSMQWPDTFAFDNEGWLWFTSNRLHLFMNGSADFSGKDGAMVRLWKVYIGEMSYLFQANKNSEPDSDVCLKSEWTVFSLMLFILYFLS